MVTRMKVVLKVLGIIILLPIAVFACLSGSSQVYLARGSTFSHEIETNPVWEIMRNTDVRYVPEPGIMYVEKATLKHVFRNGVFLLCTLCLIGLGIPLVFIFGIVLIIYGLFTAKWSEFGFGILFLAVGPFVLGLGIVLGGLGLWFGLLIQDCTPAYALTWIVFGGMFGLVGGLLGVFPLVLLYPDIFSSDSRGSEKTIYNTKGKRIGYIED